MTLKFTGKSAKAWSKKLKVAKIPRRKKGDRELLEKENDDLWRDLIHKEGECQLCHSRSRLQAHHIRRRTHYSTRWEILNGILLCYDCHIEGIHKDSGYYFEKILSKIGTPRWEYIKMLSSKLIKKDLEFNRLWNIKLKEWTRMGYFTSMEEEMQKIKKCETIKELEF